MLCIISLILSSVQFSRSVMSLQRGLFATSWTAACQPTLFITNSQSLLKFMSIASVMPSNHLILWCPLLLPLQSFPASGSFPMSQFFASGGQSIGVSASVSVKCQQIWKTQQWPPDWKRSVFIPIPKKGNAKEGSNYCTIALILHTSKIMPQILQARLQ